MDDVTRREQEEELRRRAGLCGTCCHLRVLVSDKGSVFAQCVLGLTDTAYAKYPHLPVWRCRGWTPAPATEPAGR